MRGRAALDLELPPGTTRVVVALSGGADSTALLGALVRLRAAGGLGADVRAIHVDHGLQAAAADFVQTCMTQCRALDVPLCVRQAGVAAEGGSVEAAARAARYAVFATDLQCNECLLTAHHRDDQAETVLLQLLRGAGLKGLSAMPHCRRLGAGWHLRPALRLARTELHALGVAGTAAMAVDDPMNADPRFDRNFLRGSVWPLLASRWPGAAAALSRSARHAAEAQRLLDAIARDDLAAVRDGDALSIVGLRRLSHARRANAVRFWLQGQGIDVPSDVRLHEALHQILAADAAKSPAVGWGAHALRRYRNRLCLTSATALRLPGPLQWRVAQGGTLELGAGLGTLQWVTVRGGLDAARLPGMVTVRPRSGGETLRPAREARTQTLQHLCQARGIFPWMRAALPLIFADDQLLAVADLWLNSAHCVPPRDAGYLPAWRGAPDIL